MDDPRDDPARSSGFSMASSALMRGPSNDSQLDNQHMLFDSEVEAPARRPRGFLDRMLGRTQSGGHRATASMSILIPPPSSAPSDPKLTTGNSAPTSPVSRSKIQIAPAPALAHRIPFPPGPLLRCISKWLTGRSRSHFSGCIMITRTWNNISRSCVLQ
jgi:hypothetical protein